MSLYLLIGILGAPVFRGGAHGIDQFAAVSDGGVIALAPTGGYLVGMLLAGWIVGRLADLGWDRTVLGTVGAMLIGIPNEHVPTAPLQKALLKAVGGSSS